MYNSRNKIFSRHRCDQGSSSGAGNCTDEPRRCPLARNVHSVDKAMTHKLNRQSAECESEEDNTKCYFTKLSEQIIYENPRNSAATGMETHECVSHGVIHST